MNQKECCKEVKRIPCKRCGKKVCPSGGCAECKYIDNALICMKCVEERKYEKFLTDLLVCFSDDEYHQQKDLPYNLSTVL